MSSPVYSLSQTGITQKGNECIFPSPDCLYSLFSPIPIMTVLDHKQQISDVVAWWVYGDRTRKMESHVWISLQGEPTLAKAEAAWFMFSIGANIFVFKSSFLFFWLNYYYACILLPTRVLLLREWDTDQQMRGCWRNPAVHQMVSITAELWNHLWS